MSYFSLNRFTISLKIWLYHSESLFLQRRRIGGYVRTTTERNDNGRAGVNLAESSADGTIQMSGIRF